jgi:hypothetical protein
MKGMHRYRRGACTYCHKPDDKGASKLHETAALLRGAAKTLTLWLADHIAVMAPNESDAVWKQIKECNRVAGAKLRMARIRAERAAERRT